MPSVAENRAAWDGDYDWSQCGEEWSGPWGSSEAQWRTTVLPRIQRFLPAGRVLEIAPGFGRWTHFLRDHCAELVGVDLSEECVAACRSRFSGDPRLTFHANDGQSLAMVADASIDFAFSFDSLVHVEAEVIESYLRELARVLTPHGVAFIHHSNAGAYPAATLDVENVHWRGATVSGDGFARLAASLGLSCIAQERLSWGVPAHFLSDCFSVVVRAGSQLDAPLVVKDDPELVRRESRIAREAAAAPTPAPSERKPIVLTLLVRDEVDVIAANIDHHLAQGVDFVIATDNGSVDGTLEVLRRYEQDGVLRVIEEPSDDYSQAVWVTRMARIAYEEYGAQWVINADADEFWWPKRGTLADSLLGLSPDVGIVAAPRLNFLPRPEDGRPVLERMTIREAASFTDPERDGPGHKVCHRGHPLVEVEQGNHAVHGTGFAPLEGREPLVILHFPMRSFAQFANKIRKGGAAYARNTELDPTIGWTWRKLYELDQAGGLEAHYAKDVYDDARVAEGLAAGTLVDDRRLAALARPVPGPRVHVASSPPPATDEHPALRFEGQTDAQECTLLTGLAAAVEHGCIVEIGSYRGRSTVALALGARDRRAPVYAVEPHAEFTGVMGGSYGPADRVAFLANLEAAGVAERVSHIALPSDQAALSWREPIGLLFVDGDHSEAGVRRDVGLWTPHLVDGGCLLLHDANDPTFGPAIVADELVEGHGYELVGHVGVTAVLRKTFAARAAA